MDFARHALAQAKAHHGKIQILQKIKIRSKKDLATVYTPGVAALSKEIKKHKERVFDYTFKNNSVAVVSDGTAVLGLGNIGPEAALPVMEGKCLLFKELADIDAVPVVLDVKKTAEVVSVVKAIAPTFGGINLEDIAAPACFEIEEQLADLDIPVFHDDQHGTAIVILAALTNALKLLAKRMEEIKVVIYGAGAAGIATANAISPAKFVLIDSLGVINSTRKSLNPYKIKVTKQKNYLEVGSLPEAFRDADVFIGVSGRGEISADLIRLMNDRPIIFALSNPRPEITPFEAKAAGAVIVATGRSDYPNQINNALAFPGIFRGALDKRIKKVTSEMKIRAAQSIAGMIKHPTPERILPSPLDKNVVKMVSSAIVRA